MSATRPSAARVAANRRNALRSTGPRTAAGKLRSRANAVKHGLAGAGVALPTEDEAAVAERFLAFQEELAPATMLGTVLAHQVALMTVRLERAARQEAAAIACDVRSAEADFDEARHAEVDALVAALAADPVRSRRRLLRLPEGVDRLVAILAGLAADLAADLVAWDRLPDPLLEALFAPQADPTRPRPTHLARLIRTDPGARPAAVAELTARIAAEVGCLRAHRATLDLDAIALDRAGARDRALFNPGRDASLARKYEAAARRELFRALGDFHAVEADPESDLADVAAPAPPPAGRPAPPVAAGPAPTPAPREPAPAAAACPPGEPRATYQLKPGDTLDSPMGSFGRRAAACAGPPVLGIAIGRREPAAGTSGGTARPSGPPRVRDRGR